MFGGFIELHRLRALRKAAVTNPRSSRAEETHPRRPPKPAGGAARPQAANATPADPPGPLAVEWHAGGEAAPPPSFPPSLPPAFLMLKRCSPVRRRAPPPRPGEEERRKHTTTKSPTGDFHRQRRGLSDM
ncbi:uncharacterized protein LOC134165727 [Pezoporus occidentalis]|uniref:uncharacterized protein LOC134165727 n=1 Tax=Pezoporus occidentalis TaxID=407982 RepID=UPI002F91837E